MKIKNRAILSTESEADKTATVRVRAAARLEVGGQVIEKGAVIEIEKTLAASFGNLVTPA